VRPVATHPCDKTVPEFHREVAQQDVYEERPRRDLHATAHKQSGPTIFGRVQPQCHTLNGHQGLSDLPHELILVVGPAGA